MKNKIFSIPATIFIIFSFFFVSCKHSSDNDYYVAPDSPNVLSVAVFAPLNSDPKTAERFKRTADWFLSELEAAKTISSASVSLKLNWYDENSNLAATASSLVADSRTRAIIGPLGAENVQTVAELCRESCKPLIVPMVSSESIVRSYSVSATGTVRKPFLWSLSECDIAQGEAILSKIKSYGGNSVAVLSSADQYGKTFFEWLPFQASQQEITVEQNMRYKTKNTSEADIQAGTEVVSLEEALNEVFDTHPGYIICAAANTQDVETILNTYNAKNCNAFLFFTGSAYSEALFSDVPEYNYEGFALSSDPATGFDAAYRAKFNDAVPMLAEPQFYDSLLLAALAGEYCLQHKQEFTNENINNALKVLTTGTSQKVTAWSAIGMAQMFSALDSGSVVTGASGSLTFATDTLTTVVNSVYLHWGIYDKKIIELDYTSRAESNHISGNVSAWNYTVDPDSFDAPASAITYKDQKSRWALLVAGSKGWFNYRHQADVLSIYHFLKRNGYDDNHIIMVMADDIATNKSNKQPGWILSPEGNNLYTDIQIDYKLSDLLASDISDILTGTKNDRCQIVFDDADTDWSSADIFVFWSGHGSNIQGNPTKGKFEWAGKKDTKINKYSNFETALMKETLEKMKNTNHYRKLVFFIETCYSASIMNAAEGFNGVLAFTAANGVETSFADIYNNTVGAWLTNRFTRTFIEKLSSTPDVSYYDLYSEMLKKTLGSHVQVINAPKFGNLNETGPCELFEPND